VAQDAVLLQVGIFLRDVSTIVQVEEKRSLKVLRKWRVLEFLDW